MGAQIAAHLANAGLRTHLLDIVPPASGDQRPPDRSSIARTATAALVKSRPEALMLPDFAARIIPGNLEDDLANAVSESDIVIEAVVERLDIKKSVFAGVCAHAGDDCILATNTSGIPITKIASQLPEKFRPNLVGVHFFNPPRYMHLLELIPSGFTRAGLIDELRSFCESRLGKGVVVARDTPNFVGNRIGIAEMLLSMDVAGSEFTIEEIDFLNGKLMGRPKTGTHRLGDMVGLDVVAHVIENLADSLSSTPGADDFDPLHGLFQVPTVVRQLIDAGRLGDKTGGGFYKKARTAAGQRAIMTFDAESQDYRAQRPAEFPELRDVAKIPNLDARIHAALRLDGRVGDYLRRLYLRLFNYAAEVCSTIAQSPQDVDNAMCWGFGWQRGPFAMWDAAGLAWSVEEMQKLGLPVPEVVSTLLDSPNPKWLSRSGESLQVYDPEQREHREIPPRPRQLNLSRFRAAHPDIHSTATAGLVDIGDGVACLEFRSKMNVLDEGVVSLIEQAPRLAADKGFVALVISNDGDDFSLGANLMQVVGWIMQKRFDAIENAVASFQTAMMGLRHGPIPTVVAPFGRTLGGGTEMTLHAAAVQAHAELYMGLVEIGVGVLPAGGGLKEICRRAHAWSQCVPDGDPYPWIERSFKAAGTPWVSSSAHIARQSGWLTEHDGITAHRRHLLADAKDRARGLALTGWTPPDRHEAIKVIGSARAAALELGAKQFEWGGFASAHDRLILEKIIHVLAGGDAAAPHTTTAQALLDLEREAFVSLCGEEKTLARMQHTLTKGKPLRN